MANWSNDRAKKFLPTSKVTDLFHKKSIILIGETESNVHILGKTIKTNIRSEEKLLLSKLTYMAEISTFIKPLIYPKDDRGNQINLLSIFREKEKDASKCKFKLN